MKDQIHALLVHNEVTADVTDAFGVEGRKQIATAKLPVSRRYLLDGLLTPVLRQLSSMADEFNVKSSPTV